MNRIEKALHELADSDQAKFLMRFFKTAPGQYGEGDNFLGIRVPQTRSVVKEYRKNVSMEEVLELIASGWHEVRLAGFLLMIELYDVAKKKNPLEAKGIVETYVDNIDKGNNWDLVDLVAPKILGDWILRNPSYNEILFRLSSMDNHLWHQRVAIVSTWTLIRGRRFDEAFEICERYLTHRHDLIHKASGWMLREIGKRGGMPELRVFLDEYAGVMPRTMLRYAIEKFDPAERRLYMSKKG